MTWYLALLIGFFLVWAACIIADALTQASTAIAREIERLHRVLEETD